MTRTLFFFLLVAVALVPSIRATPKLVCAETVHDFGTVDGSSPATHSFQLRNEGDSDLLIKKIHAPCGCTTFRLENKTLAPGATLDLPVTLSLAGRKGAQQKSLYLETNDPATPNLHIVMRGNVGSGLEIDPPMLVLRLDQKTGAIAGEVRVTNPSATPLECLEATALEGKALVKTTPLPDGRGFTVRATAPPDLPPGQHRDKIRLLLRGGTEPEKTIDVLVMRPVEFLAAPSVLRLDSTAAAPLSRTIIIRSPNGTAFTVDSIDLPDPRMATKIEPLGKTSVRIVVSNITPERSLDGKPLRIHLGGVEPRILEIPVAVPR